MKDDFITVDEWDWIIDDPARLEPWFSIREDAEEKFLLYRDGCLAAFKTADTSGRSYYVHHETPDSFAKHVKALFGSKAKDLYSSAEILKAHNIPSVQYPGWGKCGTESMIISEEVPDAVNALEYWFSIVPHNHVLRLEFLSKLSELIGTLCNNTLVLRDFSLRNILVRNNGSEMLIVDASHVEERENALSREEKLLLLRPFAEMRGELSADDATIAILDSGVVTDSQEASELWDEVVDAQEEYINNDLWPQIEAHLLSEAPTLFYRCIPMEGGMKYVRNSLWYKERPLPDDTNSYAEELPEEEAKKIWLNAIKAQLTRDPVSREPLVWEHYEDDRKDIIRYDAETVAEV